MNCKPFSAALTSLLMMFAAPIAASQTAYLDARVAYNQGDYETAYEGFIELAQTGNPDATINVAVMFDNGQGVEKNVRRAAYWYKKSARLGIVEAQYNLADMYRVGAGVPKDYDLAFEWFEKAANQGHQKACNSTGHMYLQGLGVAASQSKALGWFERAGDLGHAAAAYNAGLMYAKGEGAKVDPERSVRWFRISAMLGDGDAKAALVRAGAAPIARFLPAAEAESAYARGDHAEAYRLWLVKANAGQPSAQNALAALYFEGQGVEKSYRTAFKHFEDAAEFISETEGVAQVNLGYMYETGRGTPPSDEKALQQYLRGLQTGNPQAQLMVGGFFMEGRGVEQNQSEGLRWFRRSAMSGHANGQSALGYALFNGDGGPSDLSAAAYWFGQAADQGQMFAQSSIAAMYEEGWGVRQSFSEAAKYYRMAAEQDRAYDQWRLGYLYYYGRGVPQSYTEALAWFHKAAAQGDAQSEYEIGLMYDSGLGVEKDPDTAMEWYRKAAAKGNWWGQQALEHYAYIERKEVADANFAALEAFAAELTASRQSNYKSPAYNSYQRPAQSSGYKDPFGGLNPWDSQYQTQRCMSSPSSCYQNKY